MNKVPNSNDSDIYIGSEWTNYVKVNYDINLTETDEPEMQKVGSVEVLTEDELIFMQN
jgi:hypothetical protein